MVSGFRTTECGLWELLNCAQLLYILRCEGMYNTSNASTRRETTGFTMNIAIFSSRNPAISPSPVPVPTGPSVFPTGAKHGKYLLVHHTYHDLQGTSTCLALPRKPPPSFLSLGTNASVFSRASSNATQRIISLLPLSGAEAKESERGLPRIRRFSGGWRGGGTGGERGPGRSGG